MKPKTPHRVLLLLLLTVQWTTGFVAEVTDLAETEDVARIGEEESSCEEYAAARRDRSLGEGLAVTVGRRAAVVDSGVSFTISAGSNRAGNDEEDEEIGEVTDSKVAADKKLAAIYKRKGAKKYTVKAFTDATCKKVACKSEVSDAVLEATHKKSGTGYTMAATFKLDLKNKKGTASMYVKGQKGQEKKNFKLAHDKKECVSKCPEVPAEGSFLREAIKKYVSQSAQDEANKHAEEIGCHFMSHMGFETMYCDEAKDFGSMLGRVLGSTSDVGKDNKKTQTYRGVAKAEQKVKNGVCEKHPGYKRSKDKTLIKRATTATHVAKKSSKAVGMGMGGSRRRARSSGSRRQARSSG